MKTLLPTFARRLVQALALMLAISPVAFADPPPSPANATVDICSPLIVKSMSDADFVKAVRDPVNEAVETIDNAKIEFSSPTLASGKISYVSVTPNFVENLNSTCVVGFFEIANKEGAHTTPLEIDHIEAVKVPTTADPTQFTMVTRIYFRTPYIRQFSNSTDLDVFWKFWARDKSIDLRFAAFNYQDGQRVKPYFGRMLPTEISHKNASIFAAWLFAIACYIIAAVTISYRADRKLEIMPTSMSSLRILLRKLSPWYVVGSSGQASLSQLQMLLFTLIVATLLFYQWLRTGLLQEISTDLLYLIGISTAGAGGSQITASIKKNLDPAVYKYVQELGWFTAPLAGAHASAHPSELLLTNNRFDIYKFQMLLFTFVIAAYVIASGANELGNVQISATLLTLMGISQGAYMGGHAATDSLTPLQDQLRGMQMLQENWVAAHGNRHAQQQIDQRFRVAAKQAADMFSHIFFREIPPAMLAMPLMTKIEGQSGSVTVTASAAVPASATGGVSAEAVVTSETVLTTTGPAPENGDNAP